MSEDIGNPCDVGDIICQAGILRNLKELAEGMGTEAFVQKYPELIDVPGKLTLEIQEQILVLRESLSRCGNIEEDEVEPLMDTTESFFESPLIEIPEV